MKKNEISLTKKSYDILKHYEKYEGLSVSELTEYSLFLFDDLYKNNPELLVRIFEDIIKDLENYV